MTSIRWPNEGSAGWTGPYEKVRRERIATRVLACLVSGNFSASDEQVSNAARLAMRYADALIAELEKPKEQE